MRPLTLLTLASTVAAASCIKRDSPVSGICPSTGLESFTPAFKILFYDPYGPPDQPAAQYAAPAGPYVAFNNSKANATIWSFVSEFLFETSTLDGNTSHGLVATTTGAANTWNSPVYLESAFVAPTNGRGPLACHLANVTTVDGFEACGLQCRLNNLTQTEVCNGDSAPRLWQLVDPAHPLTACDPSTPLVDFDVN